MSAMAIISLLHGPNLNLLGQREPHIYGTATLDDYVASDGRCGRRRTATTVEAFQTNHEGELVDAIHAARGRAAAIIINPGAFTHYAWTHPRRARRVRRPDRRGAHLQPERPRAVAAHQRRRAGGHRLASWASACTATSSRSQAVAASSAVTPSRDAAADRRRRPGRTSCGPGSPAASIEALARHRPHQRPLAHRVHRVERLRWCSPERARAGHRRPLRRPGGEAARRRPGDAVDVLVGRNRRRAARAARWSWPPARPVGFEADARRAASGTARYAAASPAELVPHQRRGRGRAGAPRTPARSRAIAARLPHRRPRARPRWHPPSATGCTEAEVRNELERAACASSAPPARATTRSSPPAR